MAKIDWNKVGEQQRMRSRGTEPLDGIVIPLGTPKPRASKAALRAELAAAEAKISRVVKCACGHQGTALVPRSKRQARLRCSKCGETAR